MGVDYYYNPTFVYDQLTGGATGRNSQAGLFYTNQLQEPHEWCCSRLVLLSALIKYLVYHFGSLGRLQFVTFGGVWFDVTISGEYASRSPVVDTEAESGSSLTKYRLSFTLLY